MHNPRKDKKQARQSRKQSLRGIFWCRKTGRKDDTDQQIRLESISGDAGLKFRSVLSFQARPKIDET